MDQLYTLGILPHIPHPLRTRTGAFSLAVGPRELVITQFIQGEVVGHDEISEAILVRLAEMVGTLHASLPHLSFEVPFVEAFEVVFEPALRSHLASLEAITPQHSPGIQGLQAALLPRRAEVYRALERLKTLQSQARAAQPEMVVCHTDLHGDNLMRDDQGNLYLLDWENAMIAPREHDMIFFHGEGPATWEVFWPVYARHFPGLELDQGLLAFYYHRRGLEDSADLLVRIARGDGSPQRDQEDLGELLSILDGLAALASR
jgi:thiamine kinase-like enzyme